MNTNKQATSKNGLRALHVNQDPWFLSKRSTSQNQF